MDGPASHASVHIAMCPCHVTHSHCTCCLFCSSASLSSVGLGWVGRALSLKHKKGLKHTKGKEASLALVIDALVIPE